MTQSFLEKPKMVIASPHLYNESIHTLKSMGIDVCYSCCNLNVSKFLAYHADMQLSKVSANKFVAAPECYEYYKTILKNHMVSLFKGNTNLSCNYPCDIAYNIIVTKNHAFHNFRHTDSLVLSFLENKAKINFSQGYTSCTLCVISEKAFITSDSGIFKTLASHDFDVLFINDSDVLLPGYDHGFIGGASFMLSDDILAVNGNIKKHRDYNKIVSFCQKHGVSVISLSDKAIMDIGSFIPVF